MYKPSESNDKFFYVTNTTNRDKKKPKENTWTETCGNISVDKINDK